MTTTTPTPENTDSASSSAMPPMSLKVEDRCDRCGAQAFAAAQSVRIETTGTVTNAFLLCAHHLKQHRDALTAQGYTIHDETDRLYAMEGGNRQQGDAHA